MKTSQNLGLSPVEQETAYTILHTYNSCIDQTLGMLTYMKVDMAAHTAIIQPLVGSLITHFSETFPTFAHDLVQQARNGDFTNFESLSPSQKIRIQSCAYIVTELVEISDRSGAISVYQAFRESQA